MLLLVAPVYRIKLKILNENDESQRDSVGDPNRSLFLPSRRAVFAAVGGCLP